MTVNPIPAYGGCLWPVDPACLSAEWEALSPEVQERSLALASATLQRLTAYRVGNCPITVRPALRQQSCWVPESGVLRPGLTVQGAWVNNCGSATPDGRGVPLPAPVGRIDEVKIDGAIVSPTDYTVYNGNLLYWMGAGEAPWPQRQDFSLPDTEVDTFSVTYLNAYPVDSLGAYAVGVLAMEYAKACTGSGKCRLPAGVTAVVRQGITMEINSGTFPDGFTGIREVDTFVALWNPRARTQQSTVWSPDMPIARIVTGGGA